MRTIQKLSDEATEQRPAPARTNVETEDADQAVSLLPYERYLLETLRQSYGLDGGMVTGFGIVLCRLARLFEKISHGPGRDFRAGRVVLMGLIAHAHLLITGGLQSLEAGNGSVWSACFRGLIEVFGALALMEESPDKAPNFLEHVKPGRLRAAAERACPGLGNDIDRLNSVVHPGPGAILCASSTIADADSREVTFLYGLREIAPNEGREGTNCLANIAHRILHKAEALARSNEVIGKGKLILRREDT